MELTHAYQHLAAQATLDKAWAQQVEEAQHHLHVAEGVLRHKRQRVRRAEDKHLVGVGGAHLRQGKTWWLHTPLTLSRSELLVEGAVLLCDARCVVPRCSAVM